VRAHTGLNRNNGLALGGRPLLRKGFLVEVQDDHIVVRVTGTSYAASYYRIANSTELLPRHLPLRDDHRAPMSRLDFIKSAWKLASDKARKLKWIR
jgi:hypothetical protein